MSTEIADKDNPSQQAKVDVYGSLYVVLVDSSGNTIKNTEVEENRLGSECTGSDGATSRVLTFTNTSKSGGPVSVWVENQVIAQTDITFVHKSASSTVAFDIGIYNTDSIRVRYYI